MKLKTFVGLVFREGRQVRVAVAATSQAKAAAAAGVPLGHLRAYWSETQNFGDRELAESEPGRVFEVTR